MVSVTTITAIERKKTQNGKSDSGGYDLFLLQCFC